PRGRRRRPPSGGPALRSRRRGTRPYRPRAGVRRARVASSWNDPPLGQGVLGVPGEPVRPARVYGGGTGENKFLGPPGRGAAGPLPHLTPPGPARGPCTACPPCQGRPWRRVPAGRFLQETVQSGPRPVDIIARPGKVSRRRPAGR